MSDRFERKEFQDRVSAAKHETRQSKEHANDGKSSTEL